MAHTYDMIDVAQREFKELVGEDASRVGKPEKRVVGKDGAQPHGPGVEDGLVA